MAKKKPKPSPLSDLERKFLAIWQYNAEDWPAPIHNRRVVRDEDTKGRTRFVTATGRVRLWKFDFAWPDFRLAVEMEGGVHSYPVRCNHCGSLVQSKAGITSTGKMRKPQQVMAAGGGHTRGKAYVDNCHKYNTAALLGFTVLRYTVNDVRERPLEMVAEIKEFLIIATSPPLTQGE